MMTKIYCMTHVVIRVSEGEKAGMVRLASYGVETPPVTMPQPFSLSE